MSILDMEADTTLELAETGDLPDLDDVLEETTLEIAATPSQEDGTDDVVMVAPHSVREVAPAERIFWIKNVSLEQVLAGLRERRRQVVLATGILVLATMVLLSAAVVGPNLFAKAADAQSEDSYPKIGLESTAEEPVVRSNSPTALPPTSEVTPQNQVYTVIAGDTLSKIARTFGVSLEELLTANPGIANPNLIAIGQTIVLPPAQVVETQPTAPIPPTPTAPTAPAIETTAVTVINTNNLDVRFSGIFQHPNVITSLQWYASKYLVDINGLAQVVEITLNRYPDSDPGQLWNDLFVGTTTLDSVSQLLQTGKPADEILVFLP